MKSFAIKGYDIQHKLGMGDACIVYKAMQESLQRPVALKVLKPDLASAPAAVAKFKLEANALNRIRHNNIAQTFTSGESNGKYYFTREYVDGKQISKSIFSRKGMDEAKVLFVAESLAHALSHAWEEEGLIHAKLKPENVLIDSHGDVKLVDFSGLTEEASSTLLRAISDGSTPALGNASFAAPDLLDASVNLDFKADIYSLGALLFSLLTGEEPFRKYPEEQRYNAHRTAYLPHPSEKRNCSQPTALLIQKMMVKDPGGRYNSWSEVLEDIDTLRSNRRPQAGALTQYISTVRDPAPTTIAQGRRPKGKWRIKVIAVLIYFLAGLFIAINAYLIYMLIA